MIDPAKKFKGGRPYYHRYMPSPVEIPVNQDWTQRLAMMRREKRQRIVLRLGVGVICVGVLGTTWWMTVV